MASLGSPLVTRSRLHLALATSSSLPDWEVDDRPLDAALAERGVRVAHPVWDDPAVDWSAFDACLVRTTWDYAERRDEFVAWAESTARATRLDNPVALIRWNTRKDYLRELHELGVPLAPTEWLAAGQPADVAALVRARGWQRAFLKPWVGATARETLRFEADAGGLVRAQEHADRLLPREGLLLQPYLASVETEGELSVVLIEGSVTHAVRKVPVPGDYRVQDDWGASDRPVALEPEEEELVRAVVARVTSRHDLCPSGRPPLYARADFLRDDSGRLCLNELELVEPSLFFRHGPGAAERLADAWLARLGR